MKGKRGLFDAAEYKGLLVMPSQKFFHYSDEDVAAIIAYLRQGTTPDGEIIDPGKMPWGLYAGQTDQELEAVARYLQSLP